MTRDMLLMKVSALANGSIAPQSLMQAIDGYVESALAAERERALCDALAWAWYEIGDGDHRDKGGFDPGRDEFVAAGLIAIRAITPAPGAADTTTEGT